jgi:hypothetical protein
MHTLTTLHPLDQSQTQQLHGVTKHIPDVDKQEQPSPGLLFTSMRDLDSLPCRTDQVTHLETPSNKCRRFTFDVCSVDCIGVCGEVIDDVVYLWLI